MTYKGENYLRLKILLCLLDITCILCIVPVISQTKPNVNPIINQNEIVGQDDAVMVLVPAGEFIMGPDTSNKNNKETHTVYLDMYYIDKYEVTNGQYAQFLNVYGKDTDDTGNKMIYEHHWGLKKVNGRWETRTGYETYPVVNVTWYGANQYAKWTGKRLPTEAEWEKAARGTDSRTFPWGNAWDGKRCNFADKNTTFTWSDKTVTDGYKYTAPVGSYESGKSPYGCYDMAGNVWEWCADWYANEYYSVVAGLVPANNPTGPSSGTYKVLRGGSWFSILYGLERDWNEPEFRYFDIGFRCARTGTSGS